MSAPGSEDQQPGVRSGSSRGRARSIALLAAIALVTLGLDQLIKAVVERTLPEQQNVPVLGPVLQLYFVRNPGAAFSFASGQTWILTLFAVAVVIAIALSARRIRSMRWAAVFGLVLGGVMGNLVDRLFRPPGFGQGHVVDYIATTWLIPAIYNIADMAIVFGMASFVLLVLFNVGLDGQRGHRASGRDGERSGSERASGT